MSIGWHRRTDGEAAASTGADVQGAVLLAAAQVIDRAQQAAVRHRLL